MSPWQASIAAVAVALAAVTPAGADDDPFGIVETRADGVAGKCTYSGMTTADGLVRFAYGGAAAAVTSAAEAPELVALTCTLVSPEQGLPGEQPELRASAACEAASACSVLPSVAGPWPVRPVLVCVEVLAVFGEVERALPESCSNTPL